MQMLAKLPAPHAAVHHPARSRLVSRRVVPFRAVRQLSASRADGNASPSHSTPATTAAHSASSTFLTTFGLYLLSELPAAAQLEYQPAYDPKSYWVTFGLFVLTVPGLWSLIKRSPKAKTVRKTYEVDGPSKPGAMAIDDRARAIFQYFKKYNYEVKGQGEVISFIGTYAADKGQAASLVFYTFFSLASIALVLSITVPTVGNWWYAMTLLSPAAGAYYWSRATRQEEVQVKMVTADDDSVTDIIVQGDQEELERLAKELDLIEKGKIRVKGILENLA